MHNPVAAGETRFDPPEPDLTPQEMKARAVALRPEIMARAAETEAAGTYSRELHEMFEAAGFYRALIPRRYGGYEFDLKDVFSVQMELARGDVSTAWCMSLAANHALELASWFTEPAQREIFGTGDFRAASVAAPSLKAERVEGGYRLEGTVAYCSGIPWSTHYMGQAMLPELGADGEPKLLLFFAARDAFEMLDDWGDTLGLRGSGSNSIRFHGAVIPEHWAIEDAFMIDFPVEGGTPGYELHGNPLYAGRALCTFAMSLAVLVIGGGYGALDEYENWMRAKPHPMPPFDPRVEDPDFKRWYGSAFGKLQFAEAAVMNGLDQHAELCRLNATRERPYTYADDHRVGVIGREAILWAWEAVERDLYRTIGSSAARAGQRFERYFRDLAMAAGHRNSFLREGSFRELADFALDGAYKR
jgi:3-hydroxy-9,10-secoandrosta-1,3,5(10)-triene-9,17-dione monooxygenase